MSTTLSSPVLILEYKVLVYHGGSYKPKVRPKLFNIKRCRAALGKMNQSKISDILEAFR